MEKKHIQFLPAKLKCDAVGCDHIETVGTITAELIGKPCRKCGANLLTEDDFIAGQAWLAVLNAINDTCPPIPDGVSTSRIKMSVNPHAGELNVTLSPADEA